jgi:G3E family GTPase
VAAGPGAHRAAATGCAVIPVTVLTGFLGSGKTTLLARLLKSPALARTAVIINEFGAVGIDHDLVEASQESLVQLDTGCICCTVRGDLEATLADLVARRAAGLVPPFERIVIETSGLADPTPVLLAVMGEAMRGVGLTLGPVVTTIDAVAGLVSLAREPQSVRQAAVADVLVLTKTDVAGEAAPLVARVRGINPRARLLTAVHGEVDPALLLEADADPGRHRASDVTAWLTAAPPAARPAGARGHDPSRHGDDIGCVAIRREAPIPALALTLLLEALADHCAGDLLRLKGIIAIAESPARPVVVHGVQHVFQEPQWLDRWPSDDRATRLVLIGRGLSQLWVERLIDALAAEVTEVMGPARQ